MGDSASTAAEGAEDSSALKVCAVALGNCEGERASLGEALFAASSAGQKGLVEEIVGQWDKSPIDFSGNVQGDRWGGKKTHLRFPLICVDACRLKCDFFCPFPVCVPAVRFQLQL